MAAVLLILWMSPVMSSLLRALHLASGKIAPGWRRPGSCLDRGLQRREGRHVVWKAGSPVGVRHVH